MIKKILYSNTSWSLLSNGLTAVMGFLNLALVAHRYAKEDAGKWFMLLTVYTLLEMLRSGWVQTPFVRYFVVAQTGQERAKLVGASWQLLVLFTLAIALVSAPVYFIDLKNPSFVLAKKFTVLWLFSALPYQLLQWQLQARMLFKRLAVVKIAFPLLFTILLLFQAKYNLSIDTVVWIYAMLQLLVGITGLACGWLRLGSWLSNLRQERKLLSAFGKYSMLTMVTAGLLRSSDQFIIAIWLGPAAVAVYSIPQKLIEAIEIPVRSFASVAVPHATGMWQNKKTEHLKAYFYNQCGLLTVMIAPLLLLFFIFPSFIVNLIGGGKYHESSMLLQIFCCYAILIPIDRYCGVLLDAGNRPKKNTLKVIFMLITNIVFDLLALWLNTGLYGVAAASTITFLMGIIIGWIQLKDILNAFDVTLLWKEGILKSISNLKNKPATQ